MFGKIKELLFDTSDYYEKFYKELEEESSDSEDITADDARNNMKKHEEYLEKKRQNYKIELCKEMKNVSSNGGKCVKSENFHKEFMTYDFLVGELKQYFEDKGFNVEVIDSTYGLRTSWLEISW